MAERKTVVMHQDAVPAGQSMAVTEYTRPDGTAAAAAETVLADTATGELVTSTLDGDKRGLDVHVTNLNSFVGLSSMGYGVKEKRACCLGDQRIGIGMRDRDV